MFSYLFDHPQAYFVPDSPNSFFGLTSELSSNEPHFEGEVYILMNGSSFSTTGHFLTLMKTQNRATFIGEMAGGRSSCSDSSITSTVDNTSLTIQSSTAVWSVLVDEEISGVALIPDYYVMLTLEDYLTDSDSVIDFAISKIMK